MNKYLSYILLGLLQGLTEFLPVSSSGHLFLCSLLGLEESTLMYTLLLHCATLCSVLIYFRKEVAKLFTSSKRKERHFILVASLPTALFALAIRYFCDGERFLPFFFCLTSVLLILPEITPVLFPAKTKWFWRALFCGSVQGFACFSGLSRSGSTVFALHCVGCPQEERAEYSFLLSVPVIIGSTVAECITSSAEQTAFTAPMAVGALVAFVCGLGAIKLFSKLLLHKKMWLFAPYTFGLCILSFHLIF